MRGASLEHLGNVVVAALDRGEGGSGSTSSKTHSSRYNCLIVIFSFASILAVKHWNLKSTAEMFNAWRRGSSSIEIVSTSVAGCRMTDS